MYDERMVVIQVQYRYDTLHHETVEMLSASQHKSNTAAIKRQALLTRNTSQIFSLNIRQYDYKSQLGIFIYKTSIIFHFFMIRLHHLDDSSSPACRVEAYRHQIRTNLTVVRTIERGAKDK